MLGVPGSTASASNTRAAPHINGSCNDAHACTCYTTDVACGETLRHSLRSSRVAASMRTRTGQWESLIVHAAAADAPAESAVTVAAVTARTDADANAGHEDHHDDCGDTAEVSRKGRTWGVAVRPTHQGATCASAPRLTDVDTREAGRGPAGQRSRDRHCENEGDQQARPCRVAVTASGNQLRGGGMHVIWGRAPARSGAIVHRDQPAEGEDCARWFLSRAVVRAEAYSSRTTRRHPRWSHLGGGRMNLRTCAAPKVTSPHVDATDDGRPRNLPPDASQAQAVPASSSPPDEGSDVHGKGSTGEWCEREGSVKPGEGRWRQGREHEGNKGVDHVFRNTRVAATVPF